MRVDETEKDNVASSSMDGEGGGVGAPPPVTKGPDGLPVMVAVPPPPPARPFTPENVPCLRQCRYYFHTVGHFDAMSDGQVFVEHKHACSAIPGVWLELGADDPVYECHRWDPMSDREVKRLRKKRDRYFRKHPDHQPPALEVDLDTFDDDEDEGDIDGR